MRKVKVTIQPPFVKHVAHFRGRHNKVKSLCFLILLDCKQTGHPYLSLKELSLKTGIPRHSLSSLLPHWERWYYIHVNRKVGPHQYRITKRGVAWLVRWQDAMPLSEYLAELQAIEEKLKRSYVPVRQTTKKQRGVNVKVRTYANSFDVNSTASLKLPKS